MRNVFSEIHDAALAVQQRHVANPENRPTVFIELPDMTRAERITSVFFHSCMITSYGQQSLHWHLFFKLYTPVGVQARSVEFNSQRLQMSTMEIRLYVTSRPYRYSTKNYTDLFKIPVREGTTVQDILSFILAKKRDQYRLNSLGSGCRY
ncbi:hypothetical protein EW146_g4770 [Bondarzewia mesenterica]|uniref:DUF7770 domain-containing protein n=1 Tax=Bondarzewia mesenterica TaxID=1095465 RepID=A0A4S4LTJ6_9AGAM|nr:hypothetical protein EW146_g4770 [Bondarzewia mesenterica]